MDEHKFIEVISAPLDYKKWWWNRIATCEVCGTKIRLLEGCEKSPHFLQAWDEKIKYQCPICDEFITFDKVTATSLAA